MPEPTTVPRIKRPRSRRAPEPRVELPSAPPPAKLGKYELLFEIGRGGMGSVHAARTRDGGVERMIALKCLPKERATREALAALAAEAKITATIDHPNVVDTFEFGVDGGSAYLAMRLIEGVPLSRAIERAKERGEPIEPRIAAWIVGQAARGLHAAHELTTKGGERFAIVHRDVSPANLLVSREGRVVVVDFGIAKLLANDIHTASGVIKGKFAYMSPEQTRGSDVDPRSDQFSLGVVLYELLTGVSPFLAGNPAESIYRINHVDPADVRALVPGVPESVAAVTRRCLSRSPDDRYPSAGALADALRSASRESGDAIDEADVASWIERIAGDDLRSLRERIAEAARRPATPLEPAGDPPAATAAIGERPKGRRGVFAAAAILVGAAAVMGVGLAARGRAEPDRPIGATAPATAEREEPTPPALPSSASPSASEIPSGLAPSAPASSSAASSSSSPASSGPPTVEPPRPRPPPSPSSPASAAPAKSSHKGEPFRTLGG
ncbi:MAG: protein kinase [Polyangiaceae bacterium]